MLGVPRNADSVQLQRAYKKKLADAKGNEELTQQIEAAHSSIMMSALTSRLQVRRRAGGGVRGAGHPPGPAPPAPPRGPLGAGSGGRSFGYEPSGAIRLLPPSLLLPQPPAPSSGPQGTAKVDKSILYADKAVYFPWRPRLWLAARNLILYQARAAPCRGCRLCLTVFPMPAASYPWRSWGPLWARRAHRCRESPS